MQCIFCCAFSLVANAVLSPRRRRDLLCPYHPGDAVRPTERPPSSLPRPRQHTDTPSVAPCPTEKKRLSLTTVVPHQVACNTPHMSILSAHMSMKPSHVSVLSPLVAMLPPHVAWLPPKSAVSAEPGWQQRATRKSRMVDAGSLLHDAESHRRNIE